MKKTAVSLLTAGLLAIGAGAALADGIPTAANIYAPMEDNDWSGFFVSGSLGYGWSDSSHFLDINGTSDRDSFEADGFQGTVGTGYDWTFGRGLLFGVFGDYTFGDLDDSTSLSVVPGTFENSYDNVFAIGVRAGYVIHKDLLLYGTVGYTSADFESKFNGAKLKDDLDGYFVGVGLERKIHDNFYLKAEYRFSDFSDTSGSETVTNINPPCGGVCDVRTEFEHEIHSVRVGLAYKFGDRREEAVPLK